MPAKRPFICILLALISLFCCSGYSAWAQVEVIVDTSTQLEISTEVVEAPTEAEAEKSPDTVFARNTFHVAPDSIDALRKNGHYAYVPRVDSFLRAQAGQQKPHPELKPPSVPWWIKALVSTPAKMIYWSLAIGLVLFVLYRLFFAEGYFLRRHKRSSVVIHDFEEEEEDPTSINWQTRIREAEQREDFRMAIRYQHRYLLAQLHEHKWIVFTREKTNSHYVREAKAFPLHADFVRVTRVFDYVWFGRVPMSASDYQPWNAIYNTLQQALR
jgi:hypothetical protein